MRNSYYLNPGSLTTIGACCLSICSLLILSACYSVEFKPAANYPVLKKSNVTEVRIGYAPPRTKWTPIGILMIHDTALDLHDPGFQRFLRGKVRELGAEGAWLRSLQSQRSVSMQTQTLDYRMNTSQSDDLYSTTHSVEYVLYTLESQTKE